jgi:hypothetical protein
MAWTTVNAGKKYAHRNRPIDFFSSICELSIAQNQKSKQNKR